ncbi:hypothetical protein BAG01nite_42160 [Brevibacillus agri]|uniref:Uncharacterized protein n=1 Tax=Brevibacillus agri TaxID=51101 RepID=A0ABQ0SW73_9BACL|nr:hypothetical protein BAG01nite_42160 [Brevibacillus agri]
MYICVEKYVQHSCSVTIGKVKYSLPGCVGMVHASTNDAEYVEEETVNDGTSHERFFLIFIQKQSTERGC